MSTAERSGQPPPEHAERVRWQVKGKHPWRQRVGRLLPPLLDEVVICGDSHVASVWKAYKAGHFGYRTCRATVVTSASCMGLANSGSRTQAAARFRAALLPFRPRRVPFFLMGEVDCGSTIWLKAHQGGMTVEDALARSVGRYLAFLESVAAAGYRRILVGSAPPPTVVTEDLGRALAAERRWLTVPYPDRLDLTERFNARMAEGCRTRGYDFLDLRPHWTDPATGAVRDAVRPANPLDHHLDERAIGPIWADAIKQALRSPGLLGIVQRLLD
ncbi:hypothetical protein [Prosthecomicrobium sp. N25]|uniref:hypothetical protein n=1 Tax=Prosthecomicrobium sp. N25 TaxID=3129254 RepID=UPI003077F209